MKTDFFALYDAIIDGVRSDERITESALGKYWALTGTGSGVGIAMSTEGSSVERMFPGGLEGLTLRDAARAVKSWNLEEASLGLAAVNCCYNSAANMERLHSYEPFENYCTAGLELRGRTVGLVGHLNGPAGLREQAKKVYIIERHPQPGDYPDSACDHILPQCDLVIITGSSLVNKTLPHLLELCRGAYTILSGPSVPMCPALLDFGIDRLAGMVVSDRAAMLSKVRGDVSGTPYTLGRPFLLK